MAFAVLKWNLRGLLAALAVVFGVTLVSPVVWTSQAIAQTRLIINRVVFENNKKVTDDQLAQVIESKPRSVFSEATAQADIGRLQQAYAAVGRSTAQITFRTVTLPNDAVDLVFTINEGEKIGVEEIVFVGNNAFSAYRLKRQIVTTESGLFGWLRTNDTYDPDRIAGDEERLRRFYVNRGYPDFRVVSVVPTLNAAGNAYIITFTLDEGRYYTFGPTNVESTIPDVNAQDFERAIRTSQGSTFDSEGVDKTVEDMTTELARSGHPFAQVRPRGMRDPATDAIGVTYVIEEGARVYIERINIRGNTRTRDYVIRREFDVAEGDPYNKAMIERAVRRLRNLGYFENVRVTNEPGSAPDRVIINVDVVDQSTGEFSVGGGYSTTSGFVAEVSLSERNFLGRGQYVKVSAQFGQKTQGFQFSFTEPYFMGQRIAAGFDVYAKSQDASTYSYYSTDVYGGTLRATFPITETFSVGVRYSAYSQDVSIPNPKFDDCITTNPPNPFFCLANGEASLAIKEILGTRFVSMVGYTLAYNTLDDVKNPSEGIYATFRQDLAGVGGDSKFLRSTVDARYYYPISDDLTLMVRGQGGHITGWGGEDLLVVDQFNLGPELVRGFAPGGIGPRDLQGGSKGNPLGGTMYYGGTLELQFPIFGLPRELGLRGALFADAGSLWNYGGKTVFPTGTIQLVDDSNFIRSSVGASVLWASPLGPLRFDYAFVLSKDTFDQEQAFRFSGGTSF
jgi:outer membrane protein insertion porin family